MFRQSVIYNQMEDDKLKINKNISTTHYYKLVNCLHYLIHLLIMQGVSNDPYTPLKI